MTAENGPGDASTSARATGKTVLLVEDDAADEKLTVRAFRKGGLDHEVVVARDGAEALDLLARGPVPALVLLDLNLPKIDGLEVLRRVRADARTRLVPVVILTSSLQEEDLVNGYALGANAYVRKPIDFSAFVEAAQALGRFWLRVNEAPPTTSDRP